MYIKKIRIKNIRGLPPLNLDLKRPDGSYAGMTIIAGPNGSGKTTLLQSLALATYGDDVNPFAPSHWLRQGTKKAEIWLELDGAQEGFPQQVFHAEYSLKGSLVHERSGLLDDALETGNGWFLVGYGPLRRLGKADETPAKPAMIRCQTLMKETHTLTESIQWLKDVNHQALEGNEQAVELEKNLLKLLGDALLPGNVKPVKVSSKGLVVEEDGQQLVLNQLSDGYRTVIAVVMDMVRQLDGVFGGFRYEKGEVSGSSPHHGVVLIDEIDTHLHPSWQQSLGFWLKSRFPNIQFIVTTHSPFICQSADPNGLVHLGREAAYVISEDVYHAVVNGSVDEATLSELFGLTHSHSQESELLRQRLASLDAKLYQGVITDPEREERQKIREALPAGGGEVQRLLRKFSEV